MSPLMLVDEMNNAFLRSTYKGPWSALIAMTVTIRKTGHNLPDVVHEA